MIMQHLFSPDVTFNQTDGLLPANRRGHKFKSGIKRAIALAILMVTLASTYYFYSLHFHAQAPKLDLLASGEQGKSRAQNSGFKLLPKGIGPVTKQHEHKKHEDAPKGIIVEDKDSNRNDADRKSQEDHTTGRKEDGFVSSSDAISNNGVDTDLHATKAPKEKDTNHESKNDFKKYLEQQQKMLQLLHETILGQQSLYSNQDGRPQQSNHIQQHPGHQESGVNDNDHTTTPTTVQPQTSRQFTKSNNQQDNPPAADNTNHNAGNSGSFLDRVENFDGEIKGQFKGIILRKGEVIQLAINGIQPRKVKQKDPAERKKVLSAPKSFEEDGGRTDQNRIQNLVPNSNGQQPKAMDKHPYTTSGYSGKIRAENSASNTAIQTQSERADNGKNAHTTKVMQQEEITEKLHTTASTRLVPNSSNEQNSEKKLEQFIEKHDDNELLEDRLEEIKDDMEDAKPGSKLEVGLHTDNPDTSQVLGGQTEKDSKDKGTDHKVINGHDDKQAKAEPAANKMVSIANLLEPVEGSYPCPNLTLSVFSFPVCKEFGGSDHLISKESEQEAELREFENALKTSSSLGAVDLGAGLGIYTVAAAGHLKRRVLAVEPSQLTHPIFRKTMQWNHLTETVTLATVALGERVGVGKRTDSPSDTGVFMDDLDLKDIVGLDKEDLVRIVRLDDMIDVINFPRAVVRLEALGKENKVLKGGRRFFVEIDVQFVLMHWRPSIYKVQCTESAAFLKQYDMEPARSAVGTKVLSERDLREKDFEFIVWRKKNSAVHHG